MNREIKGHEWGSTLVPRLALKRQCPVANLADLTQPGETPVNSTVTGGSADILLLLLQVGLGFYTFRNDPSQEPRQT